MINEYMDILQKHPSKKREYNRQYYVNIKRPQILLQRSGLLDKRKRKRPKKVSSLKEKMVITDPRFTLVFN